MAKPKDKKRTKTEISAARRQLAANKPKKRSKKRGTKRAKKAGPRKPTKFQRFLMNEPAKAKAWFAKKG